MRRVLLAVLLALSVPSVAAATECGDKDHLAMHDCLRAVLKRVEAQLDRTWTRAQAEIGQFDAQDLPAVRTAHRAWRVFRDAVCAARELFAGEHEQLVEGLFELRFAPARSFEDAAVLWGDDEDGVGRHGDFGVGDGAQAGGKAAGE